MKWQVMVVDDEFLGRENVLALLADRDDMEVVLNTGDAQLACDLLLRERPDILFLDIKMPKMSGIDILQTLIQQKQTLPYVIFVTAYDQYAVEAFELQALDYLVKPFSDERFNQALDKAIGQAKLGQQAKLLEDMLKSQVLQPPPSIMLEVDSDLIKVNIETIDWVEVADHYLIVHVDSQRYILRKSMTEFLSELPQNQFVLVDRSAAVNLKRVKALQRNLMGRATVVLENGEHIKVSRRRFAQIKQILAEA